MDDLIGGRLISYFINDLPELHNYLMNFQRFYIKEVTIHDTGNFMLARPILKSAKILDKEPECILDTLDSGETRVMFDSQCESKHNHIEDHVIPYQVRINTNGYVGIHMTIKPIALDDYWQKDPGLFEKFELQLRSLIHEAWAEIQHELIYKGERMPEDVKMAKANNLGDISTILHACETSLHRAARESKQ